MNIYEQNLINIIFIRDNAPIISLGTWPLNCAMFDGISTAGPIPTLFSEDVAATLDNIRKNVQKSHHDIQRAMKCFVMPELVDLDDAIQLVTHRVTHHSHT
jgi:hypothetical protein